MSSKREPYKLDLKALIICFRNRKISINNNTKEELDFLICNGNNTMSFPYVQIPIATDMDDVCLEYLMGKGIISKNSQVKFHGICGIHSSNENGIFKFIFCIICNLYDCDTLPENYSFREANETVGFLKDKLSNKCLEKWSLQKKTFDELPNLLAIPHENNRNAKPSMDLVIFAFVVNEKDELLMVEERTNLLFLPAGHFEANETIELCT